MTCKFSIYTHSYVTAGKISNSHFPFLHHCWWISTFSYVTAGQFIILHNSHVFTCHYWPQFPPIHTSPLATSHFSPFICNTAGQSLIVANHPPPYPTFSPPFHIFIIHLNWPIANSQLSKNQYHFSITTNHFLPFPISV